MNQDMFDFSDSRADQIFDAFAKFHRANPQVWKLFARFSLEIIGSGRDHYSSSAVVERIRWHVDMQTSDEEVKINNNFRAYYARMFHIAYPQHDGFFRNRKRVSEGQAASPRDQQYFDSGNPGNESRLDAKLSSLLL